MYIIMRPVFDSISLFYFFANMLSVAEENPRQTTRFQWKRCRGHKTTGILPSELSLYTVLAADKCAVVSVWFTSQLCWMSLSNSVLVACCWISCRQKSDNAFVASPLLAGLGNGVRPVNSLASALSSLCGLPRSTLETCTNMYSFHVNTPV